VGAQNPSAIKNNEKITMEKRWDRVKIILLILILGSTIFFTFSLVMEDMPGRMNGNAMT
jgi:hypothetical protein